MENKNLSILANTVLMIEPTNFFSNTELLADNHFMQNKDIPNLNKLAQNEFNSYVNTLREANINVLTYQQYKDNAPDSVFPNNWFSTHKDEYFPEGLLIIYPMKYESRRIEKNPQIIDDLKKNYKGFIDLSYLEQDNEFLESTGSLIFDHVNRIIYCGVSERATEKALNVFLEKINSFTSSKFELVTFRCSDKNDHSIYHTNVMLSVLEKHVVVALDSIKSKDDKERFLKAVEKSGKSLITTTFEEMGKFCNNIISVKANDGNTVCIMSEAAYNGFAPESLKIIQENYKVIKVDIGNIETIGGGSSRCMVAEIY